MLKILQTLHSVVYSSLKLIPEINPINRTGSISRIDPWKREDAICIENVRLLNHLRENGYPWWKEWICEI